MVAKKYYLPHILPIYIIRKLLIRVLIALAIWAIYFIYVLVVYGSFSAVYNTGRYY